MDGDGRCSARDGSGATRHTQCAEAGRLASAPFFRCAVYRRRRVKRYRPARRDLLAIAADLWIKHPRASLEPHLVFRSWIERFLKRAVCVGGGKLDRAIYGPGSDVESACACDDVCRQSHDHRFGGEHDRGGVSARSYPGRFLGLRAVWNPDHHFDDRCWRGRAACFG